MAGDELGRLRAWDRELRTAHDRLRRALRDAQDALATGERFSVLESDLLLFCHGFCDTLSSHHLAEDATLFPELRARHPQLEPAIDKLAEDHHLISVLLTQFDDAMSADAGAENLSLHLEGLAAIMESHFRYEERQLLDVLATLDWDADPRCAFGEN